MATRIEEFRAMTSMRRQIVSAVDALFLPGGKLNPRAPGSPENGFSGILPLPVNEFSRFLRSHPMAALREIVGREDPNLLGTFLSSGWCTPDQCRAALEEISDVEVAVRILLLHPEFARPADELKKAREEVHASPESRLAHLQFRVGAMYPALRETITAMEIEADTEVDPIATDGISIYFNPTRTGEIPYEEFQHLLIHCLFLHMLIPEQVNLDFWNLACDIAAEFLRTELFPEGDGREIQLLIRDALAPGVNPRVPIQIYSNLMEMFEEDLSRLEKAFRRDDHCYWYRVPHSDEKKGNGKPGKGTGSGSSGSGKSPEEQQQERQRELKESLPEKWEQAAADMKNQTAKMQRHGLTPGSREDRLVRHQAGKYDFSRYLQRFSVLREEMQIDMDSFDYIPYHYGMQLYGNMPLIEPLEYTESNKVEELVIAIDTSGSCSRETVSRFLAEIQRILIDRENFFRKMNIHIIQCDAVIQEHKVVHNMEEWEIYRKNLTIKGRGGTNFTPVFSLTEKLRSSGQLRNLKGLLYFTDGDGVYPKEKPAYETAFVFTDHKALQYKIPEWIVKLVLDPVPFE